MQNEVVEALKKGPLMLSVLTAVLESGEALTAGELATKIGKWLPNVMRVLKDLTVWGLLETESMRGAKVYRVPLTKRRYVTSIVYRASRRTESSSQTESFYKNVLANSLRQLLPEGWEISSNERISLGESFLNLDLVIRRKNGPRFGVEVNIGSAGEHLYAVLGKACCFQSRELAMLIVLLLAPHAEREEFVERIASRPHQGWCRFAITHVQMSLEPNMGEKAAKEIISLIEKGDSG